MITTKRIITTLLLAVAFIMGSGFTIVSPSVDFIDVSHHNREAGLPVSFYSEIKADNVKAVVVKVSEGTTYADPAAATNIANARQAGLTVHAYHFARYTSAAKAQAEAKWFAKQLKADGFNASTDGYVVVDIEDAGLSSSPAKLTEYTNAFIAKMHDLGYDKVDLYSGSYYYNARLQPKALSVDHPWLAAYPVTPSANQPTAQFTNGQGAWQWTSSYVFPGDLAKYGRFDASEDYYGKYTGASVSVPSQPTQVSTLLKLGDRGTAVKTMQKALNAKGFSVGTADGIFGPKTEAGVKALQRATKIAVDGIYGPQSKKALANYTKPSASTTSKYTVKRGDTLSGIGAKLGVSWQTIAQLNSLHSPYTIYAGELLTVKASASKTYTVKAGDSLSAIGTKLHVSWRTLASKNGIKSPYVIYPGEKLKY